ncbi:hypothetical protein ASE75_10630 [Sphingomonas sp. Leaf17]|uniref:GGDEF domain-containing protein n=1 Tax=Sphingomonas sp. Leaf17 TaxID=1735683 RepID=UPI000701D17D|nr:GGDEF domain-containing protein [Sphingomonas sp. Leaf17]KQM64414.1 hypothetical protein ASE75_10630 [Sphingomonas sp. Leaf17]
MPSSRQDPSVGHRVLQFLDDHRLDHGPAHYAFAHRFLFGDDSAFRDAVSRITDDGVRITTEQVALLAERAGPDDGPQAAATPKLDHLALRFLTIITDAVEATGALNQELVMATASMLAPDAPSIELIVAAMIERTAQAEASMAAASRQVQTLRDELNVARDDAAHDRLTGLLNRAAMERRLAAMPGEASARDGAYSVAIVGIDRFRALNAAHGEAVGDRVLVAVAHMLREQCAPHPVARWGGDGFLILFAGLSASEGGRIVDAVRQALAARRLKLFEDDTEIGTIGFSAGVAASRSRAAGLVIAAAEDLLRAAKARGRGLVLAEPAVIGLAAR